MIGPRVTIPRSPSPIETTLITGGSQASTIVTLATVTSSGVALAVGTYDFQYAITYSAAATTTGALFSLNTSDTLVAGTLIATIIGDPGGTTADPAVRNIFAFDQGVAFASSRSTTLNRGRVNAYIRVTTAGTLVLRFGTEVNASAITITALTAVYRKV